MSEDYADFTEDAYRELLRLAKERYAFIAFAAWRDAPAWSLLWRHDLDFSVHRALALARVEAEEGVRSTHFLLLHSGFYNALESEVAARVREILELGHSLGLHFDPRFYGGGDLDGALALERELLEGLFGTEVVAFSLHNPDVSGWSDGRDEIAGMVNAYGSGVRGRFAYASDSNGYWRFEPLRDVLAHGRHERLHVLTHPEWWVPQPMSPLARVERAIGGRAARQRARYEEVMRAMGREIVG